MHENFNRKIINEDKLKLLNDMKNQVNLLLPHNSVELAAFDVVNVIDKNEYLEVIIVVYKPQFTNYQILLKDKEIKNIGSNVYTVNLQNGMFIKNDE
jgi:hypothetical protein